MSETNLRSVLITLRVRKETVEAGKKLIIQQAKLKKKQIEVEGDDVTFCKRKAKTVSGSMISIKQ